jgi:hypothetical protein
MGKSSEAPTVLDSTVLSNYAHREGTCLRNPPCVCTTPGVRDEIEEGTQIYTCLQTALDSMAGKEEATTELDYQIH